MFHNSKHFNASEFACKCGCGFGATEADIAKDLVDQLHLIRETLRRPLVITSAARCTQHNAAVKGRERSTHLAGKPGDCNPKYEGKSRAVDISTVGWSSEQVGGLVYYALVHGLRVGVAKTFVHIDVEQHAAYPKGLWSY